MPVQRDWCLRRAASMARMVGSVARVVDEGSGSPAGPTFAFFLPSESAVEPDAGGAIGKVLDVALVAKSPMRMEPLKGAGTAGHVWIE